MSRLADLPRQLSPTAARRPRDPGLGQAAVAAVFREPSATHDLELLFIRRADHPLDPWSGHMAFPGGRVDPGDADPLAAALRETREELALDLERHANLLGGLDDVPVSARGRRLPMVVVPFVFALHGAEDLPAFEPSDEVAEALWVPFSHFTAPGNRQRLVYERDGLRVELPCYRFEGREIWGLTLRMVDEIVARLALAGAQV